MGAKHSGCRVTDIPIGRAPTSLGLVRKIKPVCRPASNPTTLVEKARRDDRAKPRYTPPPKRADVAGGLGLVNGVIPPARLALTNPKASQPGPDRL